MAAARYGDRVGALEPYSIEHVPLAERHGRSRDLGWLWLAANLTIADYALGFLPVSLGLPLAPTLTALAAGNLAGVPCSRWRRPWVPGRATRRC